MNAPLSLLAAITETLDTYPHPNLAPAASWPGVFVIVILLGFFATAFVLGPIVRATMREELPPASRKPPSGD